MSNGKIKIESKEMKILSSKNLIALHSKNKKDHRSIIFVNSLIVFGIILLPHYYDYLKYVPHFCLFKEIFSITCPGCGVLSSLNSIMNMNHFTSVENIISIVFITYICLDLVLRLFSLVSDIDINKQLLKLNHIFTFLLIGNWILLLIK